jgi:glycosyltransferase involved in cell wall biosynthesis
LFLSNFYPPVKSGGYDLMAQDVARGLRARGHTVSVLTSCYQRDQAPPGEADVHRLLHLQNGLLYYEPIGFFRDRGRNEAANRATVQRILKQFDPDAVVVWGMWGLSRAIPACAERLLPGRVVYYLADYWPTTDDLHTAYWKLPTRRRIMRWPKRVLGSLAFYLLRHEGASKPALEHVLCVSAGIKEELIRRGLPIQHAAVVHNGIDVRAFSPGLPPGAAEPAGRPVRLLYAGQVADHKGVHTAIEALVRLPRAGDGQDATLSVLGSGHPEYQERLRQLVADRQLEDRVIFRGSVPREAVPGIMREHDILLFPSIYEEPLARVVQEAMLLGLAVIGTTTGGTKELLVDGENGLTFAPGDVVGLARQIARLLEHPAERRRLAEAGRQTVLGHFTLERWVDEIERYVHQLVPAFASKAAG